MNASENYQCRWTTPDSLARDITTSARCFDRYASAFSNPTTLTDPLGLDSMSTSQALQTCGHPGMTVPFGQNPATWCYNHVGIGGAVPPAPSSVTTPTSSI